MMDIKLISKKVFWPIFIIIFIVVAFFIGKAVYDSLVEKAFSGESSIQGNSNDNEVMGDQIGSNSEDVTKTVETFTCESTSKNVGYVYLHGFGDHDPGAFDYQKDLIQNRPILDFGYDGKLSLNEISNDFISKFNLFAVEQQVEEIIIIGQSAGGVIAANSASQLKFNGKIELHTLASPLNGYHVSGVFLGDQIGFGREISLGFEAFTTPSSNVKTYHHKTINDEELESYCGDYKRFCDGLKVQNNNLAGAKEFFYDYTHASIMHPVSKLIIDCHN